MSVFGKKVGQLKQWTAEKTGKAEKTDVGEDFKTLETITEVKKEELEKLVEATKQFLPNQYNKQWTISQEKNKNPTGALGHRMMTSGQSMPEESIYGRSLIQTGEALDKVSSQTIETEATIKQSFLEPMIEQLEGDIKEWQHQKKKLENRRLDYDAKSSKLKSAKGPKDALEAETNNAKAKFDESFEATMSIMEKIVSDREEEDVKNLKAFVEAQRDFYATSLKIFEELSKSLNEMAPSDNKAVTRSKSIKQIPVKDADTPVSPNPTPVPAPRPVSVSSNPTLIPGVIPPKPSVRKEKVEKRVGKFDFDPENGDELGFKKGELIIVVKKHDDGWWVGELNGKQGVFPSNYTTPYEESEI